MSKLKRILALLTAMAMLLTMTALSEEQVVLEEMELIGIEPFAEVSEAEPEGEIPEVSEAEPEGEIPEVPDAEPEGEVPDAPEAGEIPGAAEPVEGDAGEAEPEADAPELMEPVEEVSEPMEPAEEAPELMEPAEAAAANIAQGIIMDEVPVETFDSASKCPNSPDGEHEWEIDEDTNMSKGVCMYCGYKCTHPKDYRFTYNDDLDVTGCKPYDASCHIETFNVHKRTVCDLCYAVVSDTLLQSNVTRKVPHDFHDYSSWNTDSDICDDCGYNRTTCPHTTRCNEILRYDYENPVDVTEKSIDDKFHKVSGWMAYNEVCADCGYIFVEHPYGQYTDVVEAHDYNGNSKCRLCKHTYSAKCSHSYVYDGADKHYTLYYIDKNDNTYHYLHLKDAEGICTKCGKVKYITKSTDIKQKHEFTDPNNPTVCVVCGYRVSPTSVSITKPESAKLNIGDALALTATWKPANAETSLLWYSSKRSVATVDSHGNVMAKAAGTAKITVKTANGKTSKALTITVVDPKAPTKLAFSSKSASFALGEKANLKEKLTTVAPETAELKWSSSKSSVVSVDTATGEAEMLSTGSATITVTGATTSGKSAKKATLTVKVTDPSAPKKITLSPAKKFTLNTSSEPKQITATLNAEATDCTISWKSSKPDVAAVDQQGVVTALSKGTAKITATASKKNNSGKTVSASVTVEVKKDTFKPASIFVPEEQKTLNLTTDAAVKVNAELRDAEGNPAGEKYGKLKWSVKDKYVAAVDSEGNVTPKAAGSTTLTITATKKNAKNKAVKATVKITVTDPHAITKFSLEQKGTQKLLLGQTLTLKPVFGGGAEWSAVTYTLDKKGKGVVKIDNATGEVTPLKEGKVKVTAKTAKKVGTGKKAAVKTATVTIQVVKPSRPAKIEIDNAEAVKAAGLTKGTPVKLTCTITAEDGTTTKDGVKWTTSDAKKALVDDEGNVYALKSGVSVKITATTDAKGANGKAKTASITFTNK